METAERTTLLAELFPALISSILLVVGCALTFPYTKPLPPHAVKTTTSNDARRARKLHVVLVTFDGCRWQDIFQAPDPELAKTRGGLEGMPTSAREVTPHLHELMEQSGAVIGAPGSDSVIRASGPNFVSLPGYTELLGGIRASECVDNACAGSTQPTLLDELSWTSPKSPRSVAVITSWPAIERVAALNPERLVLSTGAHGGVTRDRIAADADLRALLRKGETLGPYPGTGDFRPDTATSELAIKYLAKERPEFLFIGLGETDEYGHRNDYRGYLSALRSSDATVGEIRRVLSSFEAAGDRTLLLVTADHGRAANFSDHGAKHPESANVWLVAAGNAVIARGAVASPVERRLADVAPSIRKVFGLPSVQKPNAGQPLDELWLVPPPLMLTANSR